MANWSVLTGHKLKPGSSDEWRKAWQPEDTPPGVKAYILRKMSEPAEVIAFGFFDGTREEIGALHRESTAEEARQARMALHIESQFADGLYEVVEVVGG